MVTMNMGKFPAELIGDHRRGFFVGFGRLSVFFFAYCCKSKLQIIIVQKDCFYRFPMNIKNWFRCVSHAGNQFSISDLQLGGISLDWRSEYWIQNLGEDFNDPNHLEF